MRNQITKSIIIGVFKKLNLFYLFISAAPIYIIFINIQKDISPEFYNRKA